jgi:hypothetical protein
MELSSYAFTFNNFFSSPPAVDIFEFTGQASKFVFFYSAGVADGCLIACLLHNCLPAGLCHCLLAMSSPTSPPACYDGANPPHQLPLACDVATGLSCCCQPSSFSLPS